MVLAGVAVAVFFEWSLVVFVFLSCDVYSSVSGCDACVSGVSCWIGAVEYVYSCCDRVQ